LDHLLGLGPNRLVPQTAARATQYFAGHVPHHDEPEHRFGIFHGVLPGSSLDEGAIGQLPLVGDLLPLITDVQKILFPEAVRVDLGLQLAVTEREVDDHPTVLAVALRYDEPLLSRGLERTSEREGAPGFEV